MVVYKTNFFIHYTELKYRLFYFGIATINTLFVSFLYKVELFYYIAQHFLLLETGFIYTSLLDPLWVYIKLIFYSLVIFLFPLFIYLFGFFFFRSLYNYQTIFWITFFLVIYLVSYFIFIFGSNFLLTIFFKFLLEYQRVDVSSVFSLTLAATINQYFNFYLMISLIYLFLVIFPILFLFLAIFGLINETNLLNFSFRKYLYLLVYSFFLIIAPPDFLIQLILFPLITIVLEIYIFIIVYFLNLYLLLINYKSN